MAAREGRATQGTPLPSGVEFAIFVSSGGAFDHGKRCMRTRELKSRHTGERPSWVIGRAAQRREGIGSRQTISNSIQILRIVSRVIDPVVVDKSVIDKGN